LFAARPCSCPVVYRVAGLCPGRNAAWPQRAAASCLAQPHVGCGHDALQIRDLTKLRRLIGACLKPALPKQNADSAKVADQRSTTARRYRPSGFARARAARRAAPSSLTSGDMNATPIFRLSPATSVPRVSSAQGALRLHRHPSPGWQDGCLHPLPKPNPVHDWTSHAADAFRYLAMTLDRTVSVRNFSRGLEYPNLGIV
jgi:hypothetical protein